MSTDIESKMTHYGDGNGQEAILQLPGSCFAYVPEHQNYNKAENTMLATHADVYCFNYLFAGDWKSTVRHIDEAYRYLKQKYKRVVVSGISSGCFFLFAWLVTTEGLVYDDICYMIAPVLDPRCRIGTLRDDKLKKQNAFFNDKNELNRTMKIISNKAASCNFKLEMFVGTNDSDCVDSPSWLVDAMDDSLSKSWKIHRYNNFTHAQMCTQLNKFNFTSFQDLSEHANCTLNM